MSHRPYNCCYFILHPPKRAAKSRAVWLILLFINVSLPVSAQSLYISLDIPSSVGVSTLTPMVMELQYDQSINMQTMRGMAEFIISASENLPVMVKITSTGQLLNNRQQSLPLALSLAYQNDGLAGPPDPPPENTSAVFSLKNNGLMRNNMKTDTGIWNGIINIYAQAPITNYSPGTYSGDINVTIEYN